jgi:SAM-dependent methyltransferase
MTVTGERVTTGEGGFNPTFQRHVAAYALCAPLLPADARVLDLGAGAGHSYEQLAPRESVGVDIDPGALAGQQRETHVADMRDLPFADGSFGAVLSVQSLEHVPDGDAVLREVRRVLAPGGTAVFITPNRLTFGRADEIIDPYHYVEYAPEELRALCAQTFQSVEMRGLFGSERYAQFDHAEKARMERVLRLDVLGVRKRLSRRTLQWAYDTALRLTRRRATPLAASITVEDFSLGTEDLAAALDLVAICR